MIDDNGFVLKASHILLLIVGIVLLFTILLSLYIVPAGFRGVVLTWGAVERVAGEGLGLKIPFAQGVEIVDVRTMRIDTKSASASNDLQDVFIDVTLNYHLDPSEVGNLYKSVGMGYEDKLISPAIQMAVKSSTTNYSATDILRKREELGFKILDRLKGKLATYGIYVEAISLQNIEFSAEYTRAIEQKQVAEQLVQKAQRDLERIQIEAEQVRAKAEGDAQARVRIAEAEAEAIRVIALQLEQNPDYLEYKSLEVWDGKLPLYTGGVIPFLNIGTE